MLCRPTCTSIHYGVTPNYPILRPNYYCGYRIYDSPRLYYDPPRLHTSRGCCSDCFELFKTFVMHRSQNPIHHPVCSRISTNDRTPLQRHESGENYSKYHISAFSTSRTTSIIIRVLAWRSSRIHDVITETWPCLTPSLTIPPRKSSVNPNLTPDWKRLHNVSHIHGYGNCIFPWVNSIPVGNVYPMGVIVSRRGTFVRKGR